jgi:hypothetical protein
MRWGVPCYPSMPVEFTRRRLRRPDEPSRLGPLTRSSIGRRCAVPTWPVTAQTRVPKFRPWQLPSVVFATSANCARMSPTAKLYWPASVFGLQAEPLGRGNERLSGTLGQSASATRTASWPFLRARRGSRRGPASNVRVVLRDASRSQRSSPMPRLRRARQSSSVRRS